MTIYPFLSQRGRHTSTCHRQHLAWLPQAVYLCLANEYSQHDGHAALDAALISDGVRAAMAAVTGSRPGRAEMIRTIASSSPALRRANAAGAGPAGP